MYGELRPIEVALARLGNRNAEFQRSHRCNWSSLSRSDSPTVDRKLNCFGCGKNTVAWFSNRKKK